MEPESTSQETGQAQTLEVKPMTMGAYTQKVSFNNNGDYFSHEKKAYHRDKEGNTYLITGAPEGDVKLDADQVAQLEKSRADKAAQEKAEKEGPIYTDQVPSGVVDPNDPNYAAPTYTSGKRADTHFNRLPPTARAAIMGITAKNVAKPFVGKIPIIGDYLTDGIGVAAGTVFHHFDKQIPELDDKK